MKQPLCTSQKHELNLTELNGDVKDIPYHHQLTSCAHLNFNESNMDNTKSEEIVEVSRRMNEHVKPSLQICDYHFWTQEVLHFV